MKKESLSRELGPVLLLFYGLGNILGAGIYVLVGKVAGEAGYFAPFSFILASIISLFTALSYMELVSRYPLSAGVAIYIQEGFGTKMFSIGIGLTIALAGLISSSVLVHGFIGYLGELIDINETLSMIILVSVFVLIAIQGIKMSVIAASILTVIEIFGLLLIIYLGFDGLVEAKVEYSSFIPDLKTLDISMVFLGSFLAFYAYIGFEDMVNVAEEVKEPSKSFPKAIFGAFIISSTLYILIILVSLQTLDLDVLVSSKAPFADIYEQITGKDAQLISIIGLFAVANGALIQIIMASRIVYGLASKDMFFNVFSEVSPKTKTPIKATVFVGLITILLSLFFDIVSLASMTSMLILIIFTLVNLALIRIKHIKGEVIGIIKIPMWVPWCGVVLNLLLIGVKLFNL